MIDCMRVGLVFLLVLTGALILAQAVPSAWAEFARYQRVDDLEIADGVRLTEAAARAKLAVDRHPTGQRWLAYSRLLVEEAAARNVRADRRQLLDQAYRASRQSIALAPADPRSWYQFAYLGRLHGLDAAKQCAAWKLSVELGPYEADLVRPRAVFAMRHLNTCIARARYLAAQVDWLWRRDRNDLIAAASRHADVYEHVLGILAGDAQRLRAFVVAVSAKTAGS